MHVFVIGAGALGARAARQLLTLGGVDRISIADVDASTAKAVARSLGGTARAVDIDEVHVADRDVVVLAHPAPTQRAREALRAGAHVVAATGSLETSRSLAALDAEARERGRSVVIGAGFSPGLSCLLVKEAAGRFDEVTSIQVASSGTGGAACAAERRRALAHPGQRWDGAWQRERGGSGRRLASFPEPVGPKDCFSASTPEVFLLAETFPHARVSSAVSARAAERFGARLPLPALKRMSGAALGAIRVEVHGSRDGAAGVCVLGAIDRPALAGGAVAAAAATWAASERFCRSGAGGLTSLVDDPRAFLSELATLGIRGAEFVGVG